MKKTPEPPPDLEFEAFKDLARKVVAVPKSEAETLEAKRKKAKAENEKKGQPKG